MLSREKQSDTYTPTDAAATAATDVAIAADAKQYSSFEQSCTSMEMFREQMHEAFVSLECANGHAMRAHSAVQAFNGLHMHHAAGRMFLEQLAVLLYDIREAINRLVPPPTNAPIGASVGASAGHHI